MCNVKHPVAGNVCLVAVKCRAGTHIACYPSPQEFMTYLTWGAQDEADCELDRFLQMTGAFCGSGRSSRASKGSGSVSSSRAASRSSGRVKSTATPAASSTPASPASPTSETFRPSTQNRLTAWTASPSGSLARTCPWPDTAPGLQELKAACSGRPLSSLPPSDLVGLLRKTSQAYGPRLKAWILGSSSGAWPRSGTLSATLNWTPNTTAYRNDADASSLSAILEEEPVPERYWLTPTAASGILTRAAERNVSLPTELRQALESLSASTPNKIQSPPSGSAARSGGRSGKVSLSTAWDYQSRRIVDSQEVSPPLQAQQGKRGQQNGVATRTPEGLLLRRYTPLETERLQGFPDGWTCLCGGVPRNPGAYGWTEQQLVSIAAKKSAKTAPLPGGGVWAEGAVPWPEDPMKPARTLTTSSTAGRGASVLAQTVRATPAPATPSPSRSPSGSDSESSRLSA